MSYEHLFIKYNCSLLICNSISLSLFNYSLSRLKNASTTIKFTLKFKYTTKFTCQDEYVYITQPSPPLNKPNKSKIIHIITKTSSTHKKEPNSWKISYSIRNLIHSAYNFSRRWHSRNVMNKFSRPKNINQKQLIKIRLFGRNFNLGFR